MARDIPAGTGTTATAEAEDFVRGVLERRGDHDWYRIELDPGRYVVRLGGTGDRPIGDTFLAVRDENGRVSDRNDTYYVGESRVEIVVDSGRETYYLDVSGRGPYTVPRGSHADVGRRVGFATGDYALAVNRLEGSPLDAIAGSQWLEDRVVDVHFVAAGGTGELLEGGETAVSWGWNGYQVRRAMAALDTFSEVCDLVFRQTNQRARSDFDLINGEMDAPYSGYFQPPGTIGEGTGFFAADRYLVARNDWAVRPGGGLEAGAPGWELMLHEFGHGLGLAHPHDEGFGSVVMEGVRPPGRDDSYPFDPGDFGLNSSRFTVMSYRGMGVDNASTRAYGYALGPMAFDIAVLQERYGATRSHHRDDSYVLPARNETGTGYLCLWDTGGEDTISAGRTERACTIDLNAATLAYEPGGGGLLSSPRGIRGGFTIANGVEIENAAGGGGDDRLVGNELANRLTGGAGADTLRGRAGADRMSAGDDDDRDVFLYRSLRDSGPAVAEADRIGGFDHRNGPREGTWDRLDLSGLDADPDARGDQELRFVRTFSAPDGSEPPGQVRAERHGDDVHLLVDLDGDKAADMRLILVDLPRITAQDCLL
jgi:serralysin